MIHYRKDNQRQIIAEARKLFYGDFVSTDTEQTNMVDSWYLQEPINGIDLNKGLLLTGLQGCGKTSLMMFWNALVRNSPDLCSRFYSCQRLVDDWENHEIYHGTNIILDDFGAETRAVNYGNQKSLMVDFVTKRYQVFRNKGWKTHITTMLPTEEIQRFYGDFVISRLLEMCNIITFSGHDFRPTVKYYRNNSGKEFPKIYETEYERNMVIEKDRQKKAEEYHKSQPRKPMKGIGELCRQFLDQYFDKHRNI